MLSTCKTSVPVLSELLLLLSEILFIQNFLECVTERGIICRNRNIGFCFHFEHFSLLARVVSDNNRDFYVACVSECVILLFSCFIVRP